MISNSRLAGMPTDGMRLVLLRHGEAERLAACDEMRGLTQRGRAEAQAAAQAIAALALPAPVVVASPYVRAQETAEIVAAVLGVEQVVIVAGITPDDDPRRALAVLGASCRPGMTVVAVTHMPLIGALMGLLLHGDVQNAPGIPTAGGGVFEGELFAPGLMRQRCPIRPELRR